MKNITTYVGVDAHQKDLFIAMLVGDQTTPVTWQLASEPNAVRRLVQKLEREAPGPVRMCSPKHCEGGGLALRDTGPAEAGRHDRQQDAAAVPAASAV